jgi:hypothetical protein
VTKSTKLKKVPDATTRDDAQAPQAQEGQQAAQPAAAAATVAGAGADAPVADAPATASPAAQAPARDEHTGRGGLYRRKADGTRSLIERTRRAAD